MSALGVLAFRIQTLAQGEHIRREIDQRRRNGVFVVRGVVAATGAQFEHGVWRRAIGVGKQVQVEARVLGVVGQARSAGETSPQTPYRAAANRRPRAVRVFFRRGGRAGRAGGSACRRTPRLRLRTGRMRRTRARRGGCLSRRRTGERRQLVEVGVGAFGRGEVPAVDGVVHDAQKEGLPHGDVANRVMDGARQRVVGRERADRGLRRCVGRGGGVVAEHVALEWSIHLGERLAAQEVGHERVPAHHVVDQRAHVPVAARRGTAPAIRRDFGRDLSKAQGDARVDLSPESDGASVCGTRKRATSTRLMALRLNSNGVSRRRRSPRWLARRRWWHWWAAGPARACRGVVVEDAVTAPHESVRAEGIHDVGDQATEGFIRLNHGVAADWHTRSRLAVDCRARG